MCGCGPGVHLAGKRGVGLSYASVGQPPEKGESWGQVPVIDLGLQIAFASFFLRATYWRTIFGHLFIYFFGRFISASIAEKCLAMHLEE